MASILFRINPLVYRINLQCNSRGLGSGMIGKGKWGFPDRNDNQAKIVNKWIGYYSELFIAEK
jgi:hypothetical protein